MYNPETQENNPVKENEKFEEAGRCEEDDTSDYYSFKNI